MVSLWILLVLSASAGVQSLPAGKLRNAAEEGSVLMRILRATHETWNYAGVSQWGVSYPGCTGQHQSPIDLVSSMTLYDSTLQPFFFEQVPETHEWTIVNNGHSVTVTADGMLVSGGSLNNIFRVAQFHWHWGSDDTHGSEHTVNGKAYPMELHIVCYNTKYGDFTNALGNLDGLAVLGFFYEVQHVDNRNLQTITNALPYVVRAGSNSTDIGEVDILTLMASTHDYYRYEGSLTTPGCNEVVTWTVFDDTIPISHAQLQAFRQLHDAEGAPLANNFRALQNLNDRVIRTNLVRAFVG